MVAFPTGDIFSLALNPLIWHFQIVTFSPLPYILDMDISAWKRGLMQFQMETMVPCTEWDSSGYLQYGDNQYSCRLKHILLY